MALIFSINKISQDFSDQSNEVTPVNRNDKQGNYFMTIPNN